MSQVTSPVPSLQALRALESATRLQSFTAAAAELRITHGAVSRQMDNLSAWTGSQLFIRVGRTMAPTEAARVLVTQTREALRILQDAFGHPLLATPKAGLRLSTTEALARFIVVTSLGQLHARHPGLVATIDTTTAIDTGWSTAVDVALRYGPGGWPGTRSAKLADEIVFPVCSPSLLARLPQWHQGPLISTPYQSWRPWFNAMNQPMPERHPADLELPDVALALDAAAQGLGVALARGRIVRGYLADGRLVRTTSTELADIYAYYLAWPDGSPKTTDIAYLRDHLTLILNAEAR